ncbi:MAG: hypothetical protein ABSF90_30990 [Syntrophobacteraceae bacterium]|jgi:hypothetical protein
MQNRDLSVYEAKSPTNLLSNELVPMPPEQDDDPVERYLKRKKRKPPTVNNKRYEDAVTTLAKFADATGSISDDFRDLLFKQLAPLVPPGMDQASFLNSALASMHGSQPQNELEGMLAAQLFCIHSLAMQMMGRACKADYDEIVELNVKLSDKLLRAFRETAETLQKQKGKGSKQQVRVEHVHIHEGAQAIVGAVNQAGGGENDKKRG